MGGQEGRHFKIRIFKNSLIFHLSLIFPVPRIFLLHLACTTAYYYEVILTGVYTAPDPSPDSPQTRDYPQARRNYPPPNQPKNFFYVPEVYNMRKILEDGRENG